MRAGRRVAAYCCLSAGAIERARWPSRFRHQAPDPIPVIVLRRLAVDRGFQGCGLGQDLVRHAMRQCLAAAGHIGARALVVHALNERVVAFYAGLGFRPLGKAPATLFLPLETIAAAFPES